MAIKIWLDDIRPCPYPDWITVKTVAVAKKLFLNNEVEDASFDNDLSGGCGVGCWDEKGFGGTITFVPVCNVSTCSCFCHEEGYKLVEWLEKTGKWPYKEPTVHSPDITRATYMQQIIDRHYRKV